MKYEDWKKVFVDKSMSYKSWQDKQKNDIIKANISSLAKENHIRFESVDYPPKKLEINISNFSFDDEHINKEREHNVTRKEAEMFIRQAMFSLVRWKGRYICYFSSKGSTYVDINDKKIRTSYHREQFDENTLIFIEGVENIGIKNN